MKIVRLSLAVIIAIQASSGVLYARDKHDEEPPIGSTPAILRDIAKARTALEKKLDAALQHLIHAIQQKEKDGEISEGRAKMIITDLKASESAWQDYRRKQCGFLYGYYYEEIGSLGSRSAGIWEYESRLIKQRIAELEDPPNYF